MEERIGCFLTFFHKCGTIVSPQTFSCPRVSAMRNREIRVYLFAQTTRNATEAVITQRVPSRPKPVRLARGNEKRIQEKKRKDPWGEGGYGEILRGHPIYILDTP